MWDKRTKIKKNQKEAMLSCAQKEFYLIMPSFYSKDFVLWNVTHTSSLLMWGLVTASFPGFTPLSRWRLTSWKRSRPWERGWIGEAPTLKKSLACFSEGIRCLTFGRTVFLIVKMNLTSEITEVSINFLLSAIRNLYPLFLIRERRRNVQKWPITLVPKPSLTVKNVILRSVTS